MSNRYRNNRDFSWEDDKDVVFVLLIIAAAIVASYYLGRIKATHENSMAFCKSLFTDTSRYRDCMRDRPWEDK